MVKEGAIDGLLDEAAEKGGKVDGQLEGAIKVGKQGVEKKLIGE